MKKDESSNNFQNANRATNILYFVKGYLISLIAKNWLI